MTEPMEENNEESSEPMELTADADLTSLLAQLENRDSMPSVEWVIEHFDNQTEVAQTETVQDMQQAVESQAVSQAVAQAEAEEVWQDESPAPVSEESVNAPDTVDTVEVVDDVYGSLEEKSSDEAESAPQQQVATRLEALNEAIAQFPDAPSNYVLRGELLLEHHEQAMAAEDFQKALDLADPLAETANWGYIYGSYLDRARQGLRHCRNAVLK